MDFSFTGNLTLKHRIKNEFQTTKARGVLYPRADYKRQITVVLTALLSGVRSTIRCIDSHLFLICVVYIEVKRKGKLKTSLNVSDFFIQLY